MNKLLIILGFGWSIISQNFIAETDSSILKILIGLNPNIFKVDPNEDQQSSDKLLSELLSTLQNNHNQNRQIFSDENSIKKLRQLQKLIKKLKQEEEQEEEQEKKIKALQSKNDKLKTKNKAKADVLKILLNSLDEQNDENDKDKDKNKDDTDEQQIQRLALALGIKFPSSKKDSQNNAMKTNNDPKRVPKIIEDFAEQIRRLNLYFESGATSNDEFEDIIQKLDSLIKNAIQENICLSQTLNPRTAILFLQHLDVKDWHQAPNIRLFFDGVEKNDNEVYKILAKNDLVLNKLNNLVSLINLSEEENFILHCFRYMILNTLKKSETRVFYLTFDFKSEQMAFRLLRRLLAENSIQKAFENLNAEEDNSKMKLHQIWNLFDPLLRLLQQKVFSHNQSWVSFILINTIEDYVKAVEDCYKLSGLTKLLTPVFSLEPPFWLKRAFLETKRTF